MTVVFLPIESTRRELDYKLNLARLFCHKGCDVIIGNPAFIRDELRYKNYQAIFLEKGLNPEPSYYQLLEKKGIYLYDLGDEGSAEPVYSINCQPAIDALKYMRVIFLWGEVQKRDLINRNPDEILSEKYKIIGNPAFDLCTFAYKEFHRKLKPRSFPENYILVNTNFGCVQSYNLEEQLKACPSVSPSTFAMWQKSYVKEAKEFSVFAVWLENIIQSFPDEVFLIRPHPVEIQKNYEKLFGKYKNVIISKEGNANQAIVSAKLVLHKDCSTAMQSYLMGIPVISLGGESLSADYVQWPLAFSASPENLDEAKKLIQNVCLSGKWNETLQLQIDKNAKKILEENFCNIGNSSKKLVDFILQDAEALVKNIAPYKIIDSRATVQKFKLFIRKYLPLHYKVAKAASETMIRFTKKEVLEKMALFEMSDPLGIKLEVQQVFPNAFKIIKVME